MALCPRVRRPRPRAAGPAAEVDGDYRRLLDALGFDPAAPDELIRRTGLPADAVASMLLVLELRGGYHPTPAVAMAAAPVLGMVPF